MNLEQDNKLLQDKIHQLELIIQGFKLPNFKELQQELKQAYERIYHLENEIEKLKFQLRSRDQEMLAYEKMNVTLPVSITKTGTMNQQIKEACWQNHSTIYADQTIKIATTTKLEQGIIKIQYSFNNISDDVLSIYGSFAQTFGVKVIYSVLNEPIMKGRILDWNIQAQILDINYDLPTLQLKINAKAVSLLVPCSINKIFEQTQDSIIESSPIVLDFKLPLESQTFKLLGKIHQIEVGMNTKIRGEYAKQLASQLMKYH